jgi:hypothetical protein
MVPIDGQIIMLLACENFSSHERYHVPAVLNDFQNKELITFTSFAIEIGIFGV